MRGNIRQFLPGLARPVSLSSPPRPSASHIHLTPALAQLSLPTALSPTSPPKPNFRSCPICCRTVAKNALLFRCTRCQFFFHRKCINFGRAPAPTHWCCTNCSNLPSPPNMPTSNLSCTPPHPPSPPLPSPSPSPPSPPQPSSSFHPYSPPHSTLLHHTPSHPPSPHLSPSPGGTLRVETMIREALCLTRGVVLFCSSTATGFSTVGLS